MRPKCTSIEVKDDLRKLQNNAYITQPWTWIIKTPKPTWHCSDPAPTQRKNKNTFRKDICQPPHGGFLWARRDRQGNTGLQLPQWCFSFWKRPGIWRNSSEVFFPIRSGWRRISNARLPVRGRGRSSVPHQPPHSRAASPPQAPKEGSKLPTRRFTSPTWKTPSGGSLFLPTYRTERVKSPGLLLLGLAKKLPSTPLVNSRFSASTPVIFGWNHLERERVSNEKQRILSVLLSTPSLLKCLSRVVNKTTNQDLPCPFPLGHRPVLAFPLVGAWDPARPLVGLGLRGIKPVIGWAKPKKTAHVIRRLSTWSGNEWMKEQPTS